jgi:phospholipid N-methyltransferase
MTRGDTWTFLRAFLAKPRQVGAILPSSSRLAQCMADGVAWPQARAVVEWGPGTGVLTREIVRRASPGTRILAIEIQHQFATRLRQRFPQVTVCHDSVASTAAICQREGLEQVDAILSGLPWAVFPAADQAEYLAAARTVLRPGGQFVTFAYLQGLLLPAARRFRRLLEAHFDQVTLSPIVWANVPPALAYYCRR